MALMNFTSCSSTNCLAPWSAFEALPSSSNACIFNGYLFPPTRSPPVLFTASIQILFPVSPGSPHPALGPDRAQRKPTVIVSPWGYFTPICWSGRWLSIAASSSLSPAGSAAASAFLVPPVRDKAPAVERAAPPIPASFIKSRRFISDCFLRFFRFIIYPPFVLCAPLLPLRGSHSGRLALLPVSVWDWKVLPSKNPFGSPRLTSSL